MPSERDFERVVLFRGANVSRKPDGDPGEGAHARPSQPDPLATEADLGGGGEKLVRHNVHLERLSCRRPSISITDILIMVIFFITRRPWQWVV